MVQANTRFVSSQRIDARSTSAITMAISRRSGPNWAGLRNERCATRSSPLCVTSGRQCLTICSDRSKADSGIRCLQDREDSVPEVRHRKLRRLPQRFTIAVINKDRGTAGRVGAIDVPPTITDEEASFQIDSVSCSRALEHAGRRLAAITGIAMSRAAVETNFDPIE